MVDATISGLGVVNRTVDNPVLPCESYTDNLPPVGEDLQCVSRPYRNTKRTVMVTYPL